MMPLVAELTGAQQDAIDQWWADKPFDSYENTDNFRYARKGNEAEEAAYNEAQSWGCCGSMDLELPCADGTTLLYGFNYGH